MRDPFESTAFLLAGGQGSRLRAAVPDRPKALAPVAGRPFAEWLVIALRGQGIRRIVFCTGHQADEIEAHFGDGRNWKLRITYSREKSPLDTGGALRLAAGHASAGAILALNADSYCPLDIARLDHAHAQHGAQATLWLVPVDDSSRYGAVTLGADGSVTGFAEKSARTGPGLVSAGIYLFQRSVLEALPDARPVSLETEVLPALVGHGLYGVVGQGPLVDIGTPESYATAEAILASTGMP